MNKFLKFHCSYQCNILLLTTRYQNATKKNGDFDKFNFDEIWWFTWGFFFKFISCGGKLFDLSIKLAKFLQNQI